MGALRHAVLVIAQWRRQRHLAAAQDWLEILNALRIERDRENR